MNNDYDEKPKNDDIEKPKNDAPKRLYRPLHGRQIAGVCEGLGVYLGIDPVIVRVGFIVATLLGGPGIIAYIILALVLPDESKL